jgi:hypothetical protein
MHEAIVKFSREGKLRSDSDFIRIKDLMTRELEEEMRLEGHVPVLDLSPHWSTEYCIEEKHYLFKITMYGVHAEGDDLSNIIGFSEGKLIQLH